MTSTERVESLAIYSLAIFFSTEHEENSQEARLIKKKNIYVVFTCKMLDRLNQLNQLNKESLLHTAYCILRTSYFLLLPTYYSQQQP